MKKTLAVGIVTFCIIMSITYHASALILPKSSYDALCKNYTFSSTGTAVYNCFAYSVGITNKWEWPWGASNPTIAQVDSYLKSTYNLIPVTAPYMPKVMVHGTSGKVAHFSKATSSTVSYSKFGQCEIFKHEGWDVFRGSYGSLMKQYRYK